jgi:GT2 family glycosyltransferase
MVRGFVDSGKAVAGVPHTNRTSIYEEADACVRHWKDDIKIMRTQVSRYRGLGFVHDDLIESGLMMFNLQEPRTRPFLDGWWTEIEHYSKRDQLSVNFALKQAGIEWHRLIEPPSSIRNHPLFAFVPHGGGGPSSQLIDALCLPISDPYSGPSFADVRMQRIAAQRNRRIDVVVCVHNALNEVRQCLDSILRARVSEQQRLIIIDDGSDDPTARYLEEFARAVALAELHRNDQASGYTRSANQGLARSSGELVILLNSDTIVTDAWAEKLADAVFSTSGAGIVGPISNAASHQSIPENWGSTSQTAINKLPLGVTAEDLNRCCERWTVADALPRVPLIHGFCFGITRTAIERIGMFDEANYPRGYGEEDDYCFRATDAGFGLVVATHTFVYHAKSKSFSNPERMSLMKAGSQTLTRTHGRARIARAVRSMEENPMLVRLRRRAHKLQSARS